MKMSQSQVTPPVITVPYESFVELYDQVQELAKQVEILKRAAIPEWLTRTEAMAYLRCGSTKLWDLQRNLTLETTHIGYKRLYSFASCEEYLNRRRVSKAILDDHLKELLSLRKAIKK